MSLARRPDFEREHPLDVCEVVELEKRIAEKGTPLLALMQRAGAAVAEVASAEALAAKADGKPSSIVVFAGTGNNGGDGWVAANLLRREFEKSREDASIAIAAPIPPGDVSAQPAREAIDSVLRDGLEEYPGIEVFVSPEREALASLLKSASVVVDAMLGTGFSHCEVREPLGGWIEMIGEMKADAGFRVVSVDCPSGLDSQTGVLGTPTVCADVTVTMLAVKPGLVQPGALSCVGDLLLAPLV